MSSELANLMLASFCLLINSHHFPDVCVHCHRLKTILNLSSLLLTTSSSSHPLHVSISNNSACLFHIISPLLLSFAVSLCLCISYTRSIFSPPIDLPRTNMPQFLLSSPRKCTALYNQLNRFAVCHHRQPAMRFTGHTALLCRLIMCVAAVRSPLKQ